MDRLAALFEQLTLPEISRLLRHTALIALGVGAAGLIVTLVISKPFIGLGLCVGLGLGLGNIRLIAGSVAKVTELETPRVKRVLAQKTLWRLGFTTVVVVGLAIASWTLGISCAAGIALFYLLLVVGLVRSLLHHGNTGLVA